MDRKQFIKTCGFACMAAAGLGTVLQSCASGRSVSASLSEAELVFPENHFEINRNGKKKFKKYVVVQHERLLFPICVYRLGENKYSAVHMKCSHQGAELQVFGDKLQCPAHGSEFNSSGKVLNAPADTDLRTFEVRIENRNIKIQLK